MADSKNITRAYGTLSGTSSRFKRSREECENYFYFNTFEKTGVLFVTDPALIRKVKRWAEEYDSIRLIRESRDGSCEFIMPTSFHKFSKPPKISDEERKRRSERAKEMFKRRTCQVEFT